MLVVGLGTTKIAIRGRATSDRELLECAEATLVNCLAGLKAR